MKNNNQNSTRCDMMWMFEYIYAVLDFDLFMIIVIQCFCATVVEALTFIISVVSVSRMVFSRF